MKKIFISIFALVIVLVVFGFKGKEKQLKKTYSTVYLTFRGTSTNSSDVSNRDNWVEDPYFDYPCTPGSLRPCAIAVDDDTYLVGWYGSRTLDPYWYQIYAQSTGTDYIPVSNGLNTFYSINTLD